MPPWIPITLTAALFQTWRTALQQRLRGRLSVGAAGLVRYLYAVPVGVALLAAYCAATGQGVPAVTPGFVGWCAAAGLAQIVGTSLLIMAFGHRSFAVGTAYAKTDAVQSAFVAWVVLGERLAPWAWLGVGLGVGGVLVLSLAGKGLRGRALLAASVQPGALCGLGAGTGFALAGVGIKAATGALGVADGVLAALVALVVTNVLQTLMQGGFMAWRESGGRERAGRERGGLRSAFTEWRSAMWVGVLSACGSACWFAGFALAPVALVRTVGQVELVFTLLFSRFYVREVVRGAELLGLGLIVAGVVLVLGVGR